MNVIRYFQEAGRLSADRRVTEGSEVRVTLAHLPGHEVALLRGFGRRHAREQVECLPVSILR